MSSTEKGVMWILVIVLAVYGLYVVMQGSGPGQQSPDSGTASTTPEVPAEWMSYSDKEDTYTLSVPPDFSIDEEYVMLHDEATTGTSFIVPASYVSSTTLSADSHISIVQTVDISEEQGCTAERFLDTPATSTEVIDHGVVYSFAEFNEGAAGNRYEQYVYALPESVPCTAVIYFIHSTVLENYPEGTVTVFDRNALMRTFNAIRQTLVVK